MRTCMKWCVVLLVIAGTACRNGPDPAVQDESTPEVDAGGNTKGPPKHLTVDLGGGVKMKMVLIPAGEFMMGSPGNEDRAFDEHPQHRVRITKAFYIGRFEVTQGQYQRVMGAKPSQSSDDPNCPVERVSWFDAAEFCRRLSELPQEKAAGARYRLPTEAQWEYACRAGTTTAYSFGDDADSLGEYAWRDDNATGRIHAVGQKRPNPWALYDVHGNVEEWCSDWYNEDYYGKSPVDDPPGPNSGRSRVLRGGGYSVGKKPNRDVHRSAYRDHQAPDNRYPAIGFRVARDPAP